MSELDNRRPLKTRGAAWAGALAGTLGRAGVSPDIISLFSIVFAALGGAFLLVAGHADGGWRVVVLVGAAVSIQLRLAANMLDGMVAVEHGLGGPMGPIWNELPDRVADVLFLAAAGYAAYGMGMQAGPALGWLAAVLAVMTAYVRELGRGLGLAADFCGPMAKPHRMFALTVTCLVSAAEPLWHWQGPSLVIGLSVIAAGTAYTVARRIRRLALALGKRT